MSAKESPLEWRRKHLAVLALMTEPVEVPAPPEPGRFVYEHATVTVTIAGESVPIQVTNVEMSEPVAEEQKAATPDDAGARPRRTRRRGPAR